jgi:hypothetical protein
MEAEGRKPGRIDARDERLLLRWCHDVIGLGEAREGWSMEERGLVHQGAYRDQGQALNAKRAPGGD